MNDDLPPDAGDPPVGPPDPPTPPPPPPGTESQPEDRARTVPLEFHGTGSEYFRIWIVNVALSVVTLGIYSAWAKVRSRRYLYGNTRIEGHAFEYLANPIAILKGRILAAIVLGGTALASHFSPVLYAVLLLLIFLITPWVIVQALRFNARVTAFRNVRFDFVNTVKHAYLVYALFPLLSLPTLGILVPYMQARIMQFVFSGHRYGNKQFRDELPYGSAYVVFLAAFAIMIFLFVILTVVTIGAGLLSIGVADETPEFPLGLFLMVYGTTLVAGLIIEAFLNANMGNLLLRNAFVGDTIRFAPNLEARKLLGINLGYGFLTLVTLGLAYPWMEIARARYRASAIKIQVQGSLDQIVEEAVPAGSAIADQLGEALEFEVDLGF